MSAAADSTRQPIGLGVGRDCSVEVGAVPYQLRDQPRMIGQPPLDGGSLFEPQLPGDDQRDQHERSRRGGE
jgi:hypothetical protein